VRDGERTIYNRLADGAVRETETARRLARRYLQVTERSDYICTSIYSKNGPERTAPAGLRRRPERRAGDGRTAAARRLSGGAAAPASAEPDGGFPRIARTGVAQQVSAVSSVTHATRARVVDISPETALRFCAGLETRSASADAVAGSRGTPSCAFPLNANFVDIS
jgi:hypothetical protein